MSFERRSRDNVIVRFLNGPPSEEVCYFARRCAKHYGLVEPIELVLRWRADSTTVGDSMLLSPGCDSLTDHESDPMLAVRNLLSRARYRRSSPAPNQATTFGEPCQFRS